ncbi:hypothetical protein QBC40DRAFT_270378 [Triangularia verruculosa]|uniref:Uncharacterized protein n=1 Tax=Triangularia verruculosa TaxID=2587418 RepID=A0AAN6X560_9PEZI|nr:hypothetical protein QBC40DRAFT_270378 [Triangularia verruculosa]
MALRPDFASVRLAEDELDANEVSEQAKFHRGDGFPYDSPRYPQLPHIKQAEPEYLRFWECLLQRGFEDSIVSQISQNELRFWNENELNYVLRLLYATADDICLRRLNF